MICGRITWLPATATSRRPNSTARHHRGHRAARCSAMGHQTQRIGNVKSLVQRLAAGERWDMVFNICEGMFGIGREAQVPALLDAYRDPLYLFRSAGPGSHPGQGPDQDGWSRSRRPHPRFRGGRGARRTSPPSTCPSPCSPSRWPKARARASTPDPRSIPARQLAAVCRELLAKFNQPVLVETYLPGREFTVGIVGSGADAEVDRHHGGHAAA